MDTRFWGPSGWRLLHIAVFNYEPENKKSMRLFLESLPYILPCKFCRASLTEYYETLPFGPSLESKASLSKWLYDIHNMVNSKLRSQGLNPYQDPSYVEVKEYYTETLKETTPLQRLSLYWNFLMSVAYCHPIDTEKTTKPMPNCPPYANTCKSLKVRNRWNTLPAQIRLQYFKQFWNYLPDILEPSLSEKWHYASKLTHMNISCRKSIIAWLWRMRCALEPSYADPYTEFCKNVSSHASDCNSSRRAKTCRKKRN
jgi:hypothetical protein